MEELLAEVLVPDIVVGVQLHEGKRTMDGSERAQLGEEHRVVAAQAEVTTPAAATSARAAADRSRESAVEPGTVGTSP